MTNSFRESNGHFLPGNKEASNKRTAVSLVRTMRDDLIAHPEKIIHIWNNLYSLSIKPDFRALEAIEKIIERIDGKTPTEINVRGIIAHISEEYTQDVLKAMGREELERENQLLLTEKNL